MIPTAHIFLQYTRYLYGIGWGIAASSPQMGTGAFEQALPNECLTQQ